MSNLTWDGKYTSVDGTVHDSIHYTPKHGDTYKYKEPVKMTLCGEHGVGKSLIFGKYFDVPTEIENISSKFVDDIQVKVVDKCGNVLVPHLSVYMCSFHIIIFVFDVSSKESFDAIHKWYSFVDMTNNYYDEPRLIILIGNVFKDKVRVVSHDNAQEMASKYNMTYYETDVNLDGQIPHILDGLVKKVGIVTRTGKITIATDYSLRYRNSSCRCTVL